MSSTTRSRIRVRAVHLGSSKSSSLPSHMHNGHVTSLLRTAMHYSEQNRAGSPSGMLLRACKFNKQPESFRSIALRNFPVHACGCKVALEV